MTEPTYVTAFIRTGHLTWGTASNHPLIGYDGRWIDRLP